MKKSLRNILASAGMATIAATAFSASATAQDSGFNYTSSAINSGIGRTENKLSLNPAIQKGHVFVQFAACSNDKNNYITPDGHCVWFYGLFKNVGNGRYELSTERSFDNPQCDITLQAKRSGTVFDVKIENSDDCNPYFRGLKFKNMSMS